MTLRLLAVHAHPDDESSKGSGTLARYSAEGADVMVVSCTGGQGGDVLNPGLSRPAMAERDMAGLRRVEMADAQRILGIRHRWLGYADSGMAREDGILPASSFADIPLEVSTGVLVRLVREFRPHVMTTYDENGGYPHPDHIQCHRVSVAAYEAAADPDAYPEAGEPWAVSKLYYDHIFNLPRMRANHEELLRREPDSPLAEQFAEFMGRREDAPDRATTHVDVGDYLEVRDSALRAHESQVPPDSPFFFWPNDLQREAWPYEDFELARSRVGSAREEDELFSGIEDTE